MKLTPEQREAFNQLVLACGMSAIEGDWHDDFRSMFAAGIEYGRAEQIKADAQICRELFPHTGYHPEIRRGTQCCAEAIESQPKKGSTECEP